WILFGISLLAFVSLPLVGRINWEKGPYLAMPVLLGLLLIVSLMRCQKQISKGRLADKRTLAAIIIAVYALASLARVILRVRSARAYRSYFLAASVFC